MPIKMSLAETCSNEDQALVIQSDPTQHDDTTVASLDSGVIIDKSNNHLNDGIRSKREHHPLADEEDGAVTKESVYDAVVGANDQELAKRQYVDDEADDDDTYDCLPKKKRLATNSSLSNAAYEGSNGKHDDSIIKGSPSQSNSNVDYDADTSIRQNGSSIVASSDCENSESGRQSNEPEQLRKLFIGGLDWKTSEETLKKHFGKYGDVIDCVVMRDPQTKRSRGFGFVIYAKSSMVDRAQEARPHEVDGREVQSKRAVSREDSGKPEAEATVKRLYLGGLSDDIEESELRDYFQDFGNIVGIDILVHKDTGKRRGFAFIEYDDWDPVDKLVLKKFHMIRDKRVEAKKAVPKNEMDARKRADPRSVMPGSMMSMGGLGPSQLALDSSVRSGRGSTRSNSFGQVYLWDAPYGGLHPGYPGSGLDGYPPHYHSPSPHYNDNWLMHGGSQGSGPYGFRGSHGGGAYGRNGHSGQAALAAAAAAAAAAANGWPDYAGFSAGPSQVAGPIRHLASYQHRSYRPYANGSGTGYGGSAPRGGRSYNP